MVMQGNKKIGPVAQNQNPGSQCTDALPDLIIDQGR
jgi:hypothetical protein